MKGVTLFAVDSQLAFDQIEHAVAFGRLQLISSLTQALNLADDAGYDIVGVHISQALDLLRLNLGSSVPTC